MNDQSEAPKLYAAKGEKITCVRGHHVASIAHDVFVGPRKGNILTDWQQPPPDKKATVAKIRCAQCRGVWIRGTPRRYELHFEGGWR